MGDYIAGHYANGTPYTYRLVITHGSFTELVATLTPEHSGLPPIEQSQTAEIIISFTGIRLLVGGHLAVSLPIPLVSLALLTKAS